MKFTPILVALLVVAAAVPAFAEPITADGEWKTMNIQDRSSPPPIQPARVDVEFSDTAPVGITGVPKDLVDLRFASVEIAGSDRPFVLAKSLDAATGFDVLLFDVDGDGAFGEGERFVVNVGSRGGGSQGNVMDLAPKDGDREFPMIFAYGQAPGQPLRAQLIVIYYFEAAFTVGETSFVLHALDGDLDGALSGEKDMWILRVAGPVGRPPSAYALSALHEGRFADGRIFHLQGVDADAKASITWEAAEGPDPEDLASHRERVEKMWFERFDKDREGFAASKGLDTTRPLAEKPIEWKYISFEEARALSMETGKPIFVDIMTFWCSWCYRLDHCTYPDREVATLLEEKFIPVKIIQEERPDDYEKVRGLLGARGIPAMGIFGTDGELKKFISGWKKPEDFVASLNEALQVSGEK